MARRTAPGAMGAISVAPTPLVDIGTRHMTVTLFGLAIYLFCVHSFKLPIASAGIAIGVIGVFMASEGVSFPAPVQFFAAWLTWCALTLPLSSYRSVVSESLVDYLKVLLIFFVAINAAKTLTQLVVFIGLWVMMFGFFPARGTFLNFLAGIGDFGRYAWNFSFSNFNDLAAYAMLVLALSAFLLAGPFVKWIRVAALASAGGLAVLIVLTQSRGAFLALTIAFALMLVRSRNRARLMRFGALAALLIVLLAPGAVWERFSRMKYLTSTETLGEADSSAEQRYVLLKIALTIAKEHPLTGVGLGAYSEAHGAYADERVEWQFGRGNRDAHNMYVRLAAETGIPGLLLFLGMLGSVMLRTQRVESRLRNARPQEAEMLRILRFGLVAFLLAAIFGSFQSTSFLYLYLAVLWSTGELFSRLPVTGSLAGAAAPAPSPLRFAAAQPAPPRRQQRLLQPRR